MKKKIDVVIPFYSNIEWLKEALESVLNQTYPVNRIIVVNDGSKEDISDLIRIYQGRIEFFEKENGGAASARNYGIKQSSADVICFLDSDDIWMNNKVEKQIGFMEEGKYQWSATAYSSFGAGESKVTTPYKCSGLCWKHIYNSCRIQTSTVAINKEALGADYQLFPEDMRNGQDVYLWFRLANMYPLGVIEEPLTKFRIRGTNAHLNYVTHIRVRAQLLEKMQEENAKILKPESALTRLGYKICWNIYQKDDCKPRISFTNKLQFAIAWGLFRLSNLVSK